MSEQSDRAWTMAQVTGQVPSRFDFTRLEDVEKVLLTRELGYWPPGPHVVSRMLDALVEFHERGGADFPEDAVTW